MPRRTFITAEEKRLPGHKPMKDRLILAFCSNASGDCKIKPLLVYHSENPRAFKAHKVIKENLPMMWRTNAKAWVTRQLFIDWVKVCFGRTVRKYLEEKRLPMKCLLVLDNTPAHPPGLEEYLLAEYSFIKVLYLLPNTTPLLQPMDQQVISNFKTLYMKHLFQRCFQVTESTNITLGEFWKDRFNIVICLKLIDLACLRWLTSYIIGTSMGLEVSAVDIDEIIEEHHEELTTDDLKELETMQMSGINP
ncbi:tigger transposable element-derived protein 1-like [Palaemon carinicauda]|uniref:tigger transposable element-derived protein 1-like n=1 Tax=Palaemon carinicauda TaxID=392227 RepID=UPI0035B599A0